MATNPPLPPGFVLDSATPAPPPGFTLDAQPSFLDQAKETGKNVLGFAAEQGRKALATGLTNVEGMADAFGKASFPFRLQRAAQQYFLGDAKPEIAKIDVPDTGALMDSVSRGAGSALSIPVPGAQVVNATAGGLSGLGSKLGGNYAQGLDPTNKYPWLHTLMDITGGFLGGGPAAFMLGPKQSAGQSLIREAATGSTGQDFAAANAKLTQMKTAGAKTATAAEAFPANSGIMTLANDTRNSNLDNALRQITVNRPNDLQNLADEFLNRIKPAGPGPNTVATGVNKSADAISKSVDDARSAAMNAPMQGVFVDPAQVTGIVNILKTSKSLAERQGLKDAYQAVIDNITPGGKPIQKLSDLSLAITEAKPGMGNPNNLTNGAQQVSPNDLRQAVSHTRELLAQASPEFKKGLAAYESASTNVVKPFQTSPLDKLTSTNPYNPSEGRIGQVSQVFAGSSPTEVKTIASELAQAPGARSDPLAIARALAEMRLEKGSTNPGQAVRGLAGSPAEEKLNALLDLGGTNPSHVTAPLSAADNLQTFANPAAHRTIPDMSMWQLALRPFRTLDMLSAGQTQRSTNQEVARLLADNSPEAIRKLQEISMFDPNVRRMLVAKQAIPPFGER